MEMVYLPQWLEMECLYQLRRLALACHCLLLEWVLVYHL
jgi:hypothetical protein